MASSLMNTQECKDSTETLYDPYDVFCKYAETTSNKGELNAYKRSCDAKLAMEEIPSSCQKCQKVKERELKQAAKVAGVDKKAEELREYNKLHQRAYRALHHPIKQYTCQKCGIDVPVRHKHCIECKKVVKVDKARAQWKKTKKPISAIN